MPRFRRRPVLATLAVVLVVAGLGALFTVLDQPAPLRTVDRTVSVGTVGIDTTTYYPQRTPASAVLVSPGFGGDKNSVATDAQELARRGFVALAYTPRGFGRSGGQIGLNDPDLEVADARALVTRLAADPAVRDDRPGDPRVGVTGGSYGGALALMLAGTDHRVDAVAAAITYHDLGAALLPNAAGPADGRTPAPTTAATAPGVFKRGWAGNLFAAGLGGPMPGTQVPGDQAPLAQVPGTCGRFSPRICRAYTEVATTGAASPATRDLLRRNSPVSYDSRITAPTMLVQGERDTLFGLDQAQANAAQIAATGAPVKTLWYAGGHDGGLPDTTTRAAMGDWLAFHLDHTGTDPGTGFGYAVQGSIRSGGRSTVSTVTAGGYPGLGAGPVRRTAVPVSGQPQVITNPPGGAPPSVSNLPGFGAGLGAAASRLAVDMPGQAATFTSAPVGSQLLVAGAPGVDLDVAGQDGVDQAVLFAKLYDVAPDGTRTLPGSAVSPLRVTGLAGGAVRRVHVTLPGIVAPVQSGHRLALTVSTTDAAYASPTAPYAVRVAAATPVAVPVIPGSTSTGRFPTAAVTGIGVVLALALLGWLAAVLVRRRRGAPADPGQAAVPVALDGLTKVFRGGLTVVDDLTFTVHAGQVVGLLGPNGAGKTTALRMMLGLVRPTTGTVRIFGRRVRPGAPVLSRIGAFVERSGFLPHLSGRANLELYWRATGRPTADAQLDRALEIADLGPAVHRRVGTYSQGMRQRLAIAQAMLGMPELLVLDEPTNGLDPPQIHHMRTVLRDYAATGRTVLVSSHLLAEVEQTCTHVVVMHRGRLVAQGPVDAVVSGTEASFEVDEPGRAARVLGALSGVTEVRTEDGTVHAVLDGVPRAAAVRALVEGGVDVARAGPRRRLEDAFLELVGEDG